jgi:hypothetical protein
MDMQIFPLITKLEKYLSGEISHDEISKYAWELSEESPTSIPEQDKAYWSAVFSIIHLADSEHFKDGCSQKELGKLLKLLKTDSRCKTANKKIKRDC